jgi:hypothetical protein
MHPWAKSPRQALNKMLVSKNSKDHVIVILFYPGGIIICGWKANRHSLVVAKSAKKRKKV